MTTWRDREAFRLNAKPLMWLPNRDGFKFIGVKADGSTIPCEIQRLENGNHVIADGKRLEIVGWRYV